MALIYWNEIVKDYTDDSQKTKTAFKEAIQTYLEKVAGNIYLGDEVIRNHRNSAKKPHWMKFREFRQRAEERMGYVENGWLRHKLPIPNDYEKAKHMFAAQPQSHQLKYAESNQEIGADMDKLETFFEAQHTFDLHDGTYSRVLRTKDKVRHEEKKRKSRDERGTYKSRRYDYPDSRPYRSDRYEDSHRKGREYDRRDHDRRRDDRGPPRQDRDRRPDDKCPRNDQG